MNGQKMVRRGFVVFEGIDGSGTTTQSRLLHERLLAAGRSAWLTSEPTTRPLGLVARDVLAGRLEVSAETVAHIFAADRSDHLSSPEGIVERLERGELVVCDRYAYSSLAYQTIDADPELVAELNARFDDPEIVFFLDLPPEAMESRLAGRPTRDIYEKLEFQELVRTRYLRVLEAIEPPVRVQIIDASLPQTEIAEKIWESLAKTSILGV
ncbi:MAG: dTMP kinase [Spirochaetota bacterium]